MKVVIQQEQPNRVIPSSSAVVVQVQPKDRNRIVIQHVELDNDFRAKLSASLNNNAVNTTSVTAAGALMATNDLSDLDDASTARTNLDLDEIYLKKSIIEATTASFLEADETKLDGIEELADVTDTTNVMAAGGLVATNNLSDVGDEETATINLGLEIGSDVQAYSSVLANTTASFTTVDETKLDAIDVDTDGNVLMVGTLMSVNNLSDVANASTSRTNLELEIGVDVQAHSSVLDATTASFTTGESIKLSNIETGADVTDAQNVEGAGAAMTVNDLNDLEDLGAARTNLGLAIGSDVQAHSSVLDATTASFTTVDETKLDAIDVDTDGNVLMVGTLMSVNNLSDVANASTSRTNLELEIGVDVQAHSAVLDATNASFQTFMESKLFAIELLADVTDATNVTSAGALMDSELASIADVKALDQSVISGATPTFTTTNFTDATDKRLMTDAQETKLDGIEELADVTDFVNVEAAGASMTELNLEDLENFDDARINLELEIGVDVQAYSSVLANTTASFLEADETKLDGIEELADVTQITIDGDDATTGAILVSGETLSISGTANQIETDVSDTTDGVNVVISLSSDIWANDININNLVVADDTILATLDVENINIEFDATINDHITMTNGSWIGQQSSADRIMFNTSAGNIQFATGEVRFVLGTMRAQFDTDGLTLGDSGSSTATLAFGSPNATITCTDTDGILTFDTDIELTGNSDFLENELSRPKLKEYSETYYTQTFGALGTTIDLANGNIQTIERGGSIISPYPITLTGANSTSNSVSTVTLIMTGNWPTTVFQSDDTDNTEVKWAGGVSPRLGGGGSGGTDIVTLLTTDGGATWYGMSGGMNFS